MKAFKTTEEIDVPDKLIEPTPFMTRSIMSMLVFTVSPQVPDWSPAAGFSMPELAE